VSTTLYGHSNYGLIYKSYRARESFAAAEVEVLSSASEDVCERYNGNEIVRKEGKTDTKEFIYRSWTEEDDIGPGDRICRPHEMWAPDLRGAYSTGVIQVTASSPKKWQWKDFFPLST
jgi:hypothetical protein